MRLATTALALLATGTCLIAAAPPGTAEPSRAASHASGNLIRNAGAERTTPAPSADGTRKVALAHWKVAKKYRFTAVAYGTPEFLAVAAPGPDGRGWLGGFESQRDHAVVKVTWLNAHAKSLGSAHIGPVTVKDRRSQTELLERSTAGRVPHHAAQARIVVTMSRSDGSYVDGYADHLSLVLRKG